MTPERSIVLLLSVVVGCASPGGSEGYACGEGTQVDGTTCVGVLSCGPGTQRTADQCVPTVAEPTTLESFVTGEQLGLSMEYLGNEHLLMYTDLDEAQAKAYLTLHAKPVGGPFAALFVRVPDGATPYPALPENTTLAVRTLGSCSLELIRTTAPGDYLGVHVGFVRDFSGTPTATCATVGTVTVAARANGDVEVKLNVEFSDGSVVTNKTFVATSAYD